VIAIRNGRAEKVDNFHQTSELTILVPSARRVHGHLELIKAGCPECAHIHWRWGQVTRLVDLTFFEANGAGEPIIRAGSDQDVEVAVTLFRSDEEHPLNYKKLIHGESLSGGVPVFWYSAFGHQPVDTFFLHGGFFVSQP